MAGCHAVRVELMTSHRARDVPDTQGLKSHEKIARGWRKGVAAGWRRVAASDSRDRAAALAPRAVHRPTAALRYLARASGTPPSRFARRARALPQARSLWFAVHTRS